MASRSKGGGGSGSHADLGYRAADGLLLAAALAAARVCSLGTRLPPCSGTRPSATRSWKAYCPSDSDSTPCRASVLGCTGGQLAASHAGAPLSCAGEATTPLLLAGAAAASGRGSCKLSKAARESIAEVEGAAGAAAGEVNAGKGMGAGAGEGRAVAGGLAEGRGEGPGESRLSARAARALASFITEAGADTDSGDNTPALSSLASAATTSSCCTAEAADAAAVTAACRISSSSSSSYPAMLSSHPLSVPTKPPASAGSWCDCCSQSP
mmetsp:Transcript_26504/g.67394  ORF Transcript_26504/g.67394 Transcript_26504/m.67394 type:complete len:268 (+) Transcript_26504:1307-2110(+)